MSGDEWQEPMESDLAADQRSPEEIEWEIERTRERMSSNIDALGDKLSRDHLKQQAKEAIAEKAHDVVSSVGDQARQTGSRLVDLITENPLPVAAAGLGAISLFTLRRGSRSEVSGDRIARKRARAAKGGIGQMMRDNPLVVAVAAAVLGLALGVLLPETGPERTMVASTRDRVEGTASGVKDAAIEAGRKPQEPVKEEVA